jgi:hypothetical protein
MSCSMNRLYIADVKVQSKTECHLGAATRHVHVRRSTSPFLARDSKSSFWPRGQQKTQGAVSRNSRPPSLSLSSASEDT